MAEKNIQMTQRNSSNSGWDDLYPKTKAENVLTIDGGTVASHLADDASLTKKGHVQLSSATNSTSNALAATPSAVKQAYDRADAAFLSANSGKTAIANAVTAKGVPSSPGDTFPVLANKIGLIETGVKFASGTGTSTGSASSEFEYVGYATKSSRPTLTITGLTFKPKKILMYYDNGAQVYMTEYVEGVDFRYPKTIRTSAYGDANLSTTNFNYKGDKWGAIVTDTMFSMPTSAFNGVYLWEAYG